MKNSRIARFARNEDGAVMVMVAVAMVALLGVTALAVDLGLAYYQQQKLQTALDSAALAASQELPQIRSEHDEYKAIDIAQNYMEYYYKDDENFNRDDVLVVFPEENGEKYTKVRVFMRHNMNTLFAKVFKVYEEKPEGAPSDYDYIGSSAFAAASYKKKPIVNIITQIVEVEKEVIRHRNVQFPYTLFNGGGNIMLGQGGYAVVGNVHSNGGIKMNPGNVNDPNSPFGDGKSYIYGTVTSVSSNDDDYFIGDFWDPTIPPYGGTVRYYYNVWSSHAGYPGPGGRDIDGILIGQEYQPMPDYDEIIMEIAPVYDDTAISNGRNNIITAMSPQYSSQRFSELTSNFLTLSMTTGQLNSFYYWVYQDAGGNYVNPSSNVYVPFRYARGLAISGDFGNRNHNTTFSSSVHFRNGISSCNKDITVNGNMYVSGNFSQNTTSRLKVTGDLYIIGNATFGNVEVDGNIYVTGNLVQTNNVNNSLSVGGDVQINGNAVFTCVTDIGGSLYVGGNLNQGNKMKVHKSLCCEGNYTQSGGVTAAIITYDAYVGNGMLVTGIANVDGRNTSFETGRSFFCNASFEQAGSTYVHHGGDGYINGNAVYRSLVDVDGSLYVKNNFEKGGGNIITIGKDLYSGGSMLYGGGLTMKGGSLYCGKNIVVRAGNPVTINGVMIAEHDMDFGGMPTNINDTGLETVSIYSRHGGIKFDQSAAGTDIYGMVYAPAWSYASYGPGDDPDGNGIKNGSIYFGSGNLNFHGSIIGDHLELYSSNFDVDDNDENDDDYRPLPFMEKYTTVELVEEEVEAEVTQYIAQYGLSE